MPRLPRLARLPWLRRTSHHDDLPEPRPVKLLHIGAALALTLASATLLVGGLLAGALAWIGLPSTLTLDTGSLLEIIKIALAIVGGIGGAVALVVAYRKQRLAEEDNHRAREQNERAREAARREDTKLYAERFDKATDKLGSSAPAVRLAGVHALAALADDWQGGRQMCIDVLCAYLRMPPEPEPDTEHDPGAHGAWRAMREVRATIIRLIATHLRESAPTPWVGADLDFTGVVFDNGADFTRAVFSGGKVSFDGAVFSDGKVSFDRARFSGGLVVFDGAVFSGGEVSFTGAVFSGGEVLFKGAVFSGGEVLLSFAVFSGGRIWFDRAEFSGDRVFLDRMKFSGGEVSFDGARFSGGRVWFDGAVFSGGKVSFTGAVFSGGRVWCEDAVFSGGKVSFADAEFSGGKVSFDRAEFSGGKVLFDRVKFSGGEISFTVARFSDGKVSFDGARFSDGKVLFDGAVFSGGEVSFTVVVFSGGEVSFDGAVFSGGEVSFTVARFSGGEVSFDRAVFSGGTVDFTRVVDWSHPPIDLPAEAPGLDLPPQPASQAVAQSVEEGTEQTKTGDGTGSPKPMP
uniref:pentapeptide repeat-containing protein n=1 Tax=Microtetraspora malaysiensis TaxID=161358 RepID=UPI003F493F3C